jgi:hypothetical protein
MRMIIFGWASPGIPYEKPKAAIEISQANKQFSTACIVNTYNSIEHIRVGDIVYSPHGPPNVPVWFALIGKIDVNGDGKDDRDELKRMIEDAGDVIDFDLPPPDVGKEIGTITPRIDWYVIDDRAMSRRGPIPGRMGEIVKEARLAGIRPMTIERLQAFLGYDMGRKDTQ